MDLLADEEIASRIRMVGPWEHDSEEKMLIRETMFKDFMEAMGFLNKLAEAAEKLNHHPDMTLCEYNRVIVTTTTHDAGGITDNDIRLAQSFEEILEGYDDFGLTFPYLESSDWQLLWENNRASSKSARWC